MCGRYYLDEQLKYDLTRWVIIPDGHIFPYGDIHPGEEGFIILKGHYGDYKTWGYPLDQKRVFNARIETVLEKKMFKEDAVKEDVLFQSVVSMNGIERIRNIALLIIIFFILQASIMMTISQYLQKKQKTSCQESIQECLSLFHLKI